MSYRKNETMYHIKAFLICMIVQDLSRPFIILGVRRTLMVENHCPTPFPWIWSTRTRPQSFDIAAFSKGLFLLKRCRSAKMST